MLGHVGWPPGHSDLGVGVSGPRRVTLTSWSRPARKHGGRQSIIHHGEHRISPERFIRSLPMEYIQAIDRTTGQITTVAVERPEPPEERFDYNRLVEDMAIILVEPRTPTQPPVTRQLIPHEARERELFERAEAAERTYRAAMEAQRRAHAQTAGVRARVDREAAAASDRAHSDLANMCLLARNPTPGYTVMR